METTDSKPAPKKRGRKPILNPISVAASIAATGGNISRVADYFNVSRASVQELIGKHPELQKCLDEARERQVDEAESRLQRFTEREDKEGLTALIFFLKTQGKRRGYVEANRLDVGNADGQPFKSEVSGHVSVTDRIEHLAKLFSKPGPSQGDCAGNGAGEPVHSGEVQTGPDPQAS